ncbi:MAG: RDD family protein [Phycisphaerales bacterium]|nr:MAG: RDD family protein [Phycisphaerales bacterium]
MTIKETDCRRNGPINRSGVGYTVGVLWLLAFAPACWAQGSRFGLAGNDQGLWVYQIRTDPNTGTGRACFARRHADDQKGDYRAVPVPSVGRNIVRVAARREVLHLFFRDGTHRSLAPPTAGSARSASLSVEARLPDNAVPLALTGDNTTGILYGIVQGPVAFAPVAPPEPVVPSNPDGQARPSDLGTAASSHPGLVIVRYTHGAWAHDRDVTAAVEDGAPCWLAVHDNVLHLFFVSRLDDGDVVYCQSSALEWSAPSRVPDLRGADVLGVVTVKGQPVVITTTGSAADVGAAIGLAYRADDQWERVELPIPTDPEMTLSPTRLQASVMGDRVALGFATADGLVHVGLWSVSGEPAEPPAEVKGLAPGPVKLIDDRVRLALPFVVLAALLLAVLSRRRHSVAEPAQLREHQSLASFARRTAAFVLDLLVVSPLSYRLVWAHLKVLQADGGSSIPVDSALIALSYDLFWYWLIATSVYVAYCTAFEAILAATPGKLITQCRVVTERGHRCSFGRIVLRNVLRFVEMFPIFQLLPSAVLMLLTRKRQRIGDLVAGTIVVEQLRAPAEAPPPPPGDSGEAGSDDTGHNT